MLSQLNYALLKHRDFILSCVGLLVIFVRQHGSHNLKSHHLDLSLVIIRFAHAQTFNRSVESVAWFSFDEHGLISRWWLVIEPAQRILCGARRRKTPLQFCYLPTSSASVVSRFRPKPEQRESIEVLHRLLQ